MEPPEEATAFKPDAAFFDKDDEHCLISREFFYDKKLENYAIRFIDGEASRERLDKRDDARTASSPMRQRAWRFDIPREV